MRYYPLTRLLCIDVTDLIECNATWLSAWETGGAVCGDEAVVPDTGSDWHGLPQSIEGNPHSTRIKWYVLCDKTYGYIVMCTCTPGAQTLVASLADPSPIKWAFVIQHISPKAFFPIILAAHDTSRRQPVEVWRSFN